LGSLGARTVKASLLVFLALIALAPILRTLTVPTSADSIAALTTALFLVHAALADYSYAASPVRRERCVFFLRFLAPISKIHRLEKADLGALDQRCDFGCRCASLAPARLSGRLCADAILRGSFCALPDISASHPGESRPHKYHALSLLKHGTQSMPTPAQYIVTLLLGLAALAAPFRKLCAAVLMSVTFGGPAVLMWAQQYK